MLYNAQDATVGVIYCLHINEELQLIAPANGQVQPTPHCPSTLFSANDQADQSL